MSKVNLVFIGNGQEEHEHPGTVYENQQAVKAIVDFEITHTEAGPYKIKGIMSHSIYHNDRPHYRPTPNWLSVGYYAKNMRLEFAVDGAQGDWHAVEPVTTVGTHSETTGTLLAGTGSASSSGMVNFHGSTAFTASDVQIISQNACFGGQNKAVWDVQLPHVGFLSPARPVNPRPASYGGFSFEFEVGLSIRNREAAVNILCTPSVIWLYDFTRGITHHTIKANSWVKDGTGAGASELSIALP